MPFQEPLPRGEPKPLVGTRVVEKLRRRWRSRTNWAKKPSVACRPPLSGKSNTVGFCSKSEMTTNEEIVVYWLHVHPQCTLYLLIFLPRINKTCLPDVIHIISAVSLQLLMCMYVAFDFDWHSGCDCSFRISTDSFSERLDGFTSRVMEHTTSPTWTPRFVAEIVTFRCWLVCKTFKLYYILYNRCAVFLTFYINIAYIILRICQWSIHVLLAFLHPISATLIIVGVGGSHPPQVRPLGLSVYRICP